MRCFTVDCHSIVPNIPVSSTPYPHIAVGEAGRGRELMRFPIAQRFFEGSLSYKEPCPNRGAEFSPTRTCWDCGAKILQAADGKYYHPDEGDVLRIRPLERASVLRTRKGTLLLIEEKDSADQRALVLARIHGGFRGNSVAAAVDGDEFPPDGITVLAEGWAAEGLAGRAGGPHCEYFLVMEPGAAFRVDRGGRLYGGPGSLYVLWTGTEMRVGTRDVVWPPSYEEIEGEML